jgi:hypothetical protein
MPRALTLSVLLIMVTESPLLLSTMPSNSVSRSMFLIFLFITLSSCLAADYVPPESRTSKGQKTALLFFMTTFVLLAAYAIWLHSELARVTLQRLFGNMTAPLLSSQQSDPEDVELNYREGNYQVPLSSP